MKMRLFVMVLAMLALLSACRKEQASVEQGAVPTTVPVTVDIGGTVLEPDTAALDLQTMEFDLDKLVAAAPELKAVTEIELGATTLSYEQVEAIRGAFPDAEVRYSVQLFGQTVEADAQSLDLRDMTAEQTQELYDVLPLMPQLQQINFVKEDGSCVYGIEEIGMLDQLRERAPEVSFRVKFELFGQTVSSEDTRIEYYLVPIGNEGEPQVRAVLPYLTACEYFLLDGCGIDNEIMAQLRSDFPETKIVWRVWIREPNYDSPRFMRRAGFLTDTQRIRTTLVNDSNCDVLKYCTEVKYVDFGHNLEISDFSFLGYMPELEAAILSLTGISDLTPLMNCPKLEYLEVFTTEVTDLSPLASCTSLEHLNISNLPGVTDLTPLYNLTNLKRLRMVMLPQITKEQISEVAQHLPNCDVLMAGWDPTENGWRYDEKGNRVPRYELLREQMEYDIDREVYNIQ